CEPSIHNKDLPYGCGNDCRFDSELCGDGKRDPGEECDAGGRNSDVPGSTCRTNCSSPRCGDGILDAYEGCDDGNLLIGDGCNNQCRTEVASAFATGLGFHQSSNVLGQQNIAYPGYANLNALPYQLPLAPIAQLTTSRPPEGDTGPVAIAIMSAGAAVGFAASRRKKKQKS
ncbi:MAG: DUF4215 domain-containing protein, partial [Kiritimatiellales bacterium]|nr:DUF4215 domain-containing protein [Kiritimatiellales bacterium]